MSSAIGTIGKSITGIAWRPTDSTLYGFARGLQNFTGTIDPTTGAWTNLAQIGGIWSNPFGGRLSIMNDTLYFTNNAANSNPSVFGTLNFTATSSFNTISVSNTDTFKNMQIANDGSTMYGIFGNGNAGAQQLNTIDVTNGNLTAGASISGTGLGTYFHGAGFAVSVPEPSTYALAAIATGVLAWASRRRKAING